MAFGNRLIDTGGGGAGGWTLANAVQIATGDLGRTYSGQRAIDISADGTRLGLAMDHPLSQDLTMYSLSTPFDITTLSVLNETGSPNLSNKNPLGGKFNLDGTKFSWSQSNNSARSYETITMSTPYDVTTITGQVSSGFYFPSGSGSYGAGMSQDGSQFYGFGDSSFVATRFRIQGWSLATPYEPASSRTSIFYENPWAVDTVSTTNNPIRGLQFDPDGYKLFTFNQDSGFREWICSTPFDATTAVDTGITLNPSLVNRGDFCFSPDGQYLYAVGFYNTVVQYQLY